MPANSFGEKLVLSTFGESHGVAIGGTLDGMPAGLAINIDAIQLALDRRKPGQSAIVTQRKESDTVKFLSGIFEGKTTGTPIGFIIENEDQKSKDYTHLKDNYRPGHADYTWQNKFGHRDYRGGGRSSARETASRVVGGAIAAQLLATKGIEVAAWVNSVGSISIKNFPDFKQLENRWSNILHCPDATLAAEMESHIKEIRKQGNTIGGTVSALITGLPVGLGEPVFNKLQAKLAFAMLGINAVKGFEYGAGFGSAEMLGSQYNDIFKVNEHGKVYTETNHSGGIQGGISNGMDVYFKVAFRPVSTLMQVQKSINNKGETIDLEGKGRHDPCVVPRAVPIVEAMANLVLADFLLLNQTSKL